jgi:hypothetical protein
MDEDIRRALYDNEDEEGVFEELDDDFVLQVSLMNEVNRHIMNFSLGYD